MGDLAGELLVEAPAPREARQLVLAGALRGAIGEPALLLDGGPQLVALRRRHDVQLEAHDRAGDEQPGAERLHGVKDDLVRLDGLGRPSAPSAWTRMWMCVAPQPMKNAIAAPRIASTRPREALGILMRGATTIAMTKYPSATDAARAAMTKFAMWHVSPDEASGLSGRAGASSDMPNGRAGGGVRAG